MVYSNDQWIQLPTKDIYDTNMMLAAVQAAKDMYEKGVKQLEDFNKTYGDFYSPISKDMEWYNQNVTGKVRDTINDLYAQGIDPIRSAEGRAILQQLINTMPVGEINKRKQGAATADLFNKAKQDLIRKGQYSQEMENVLAPGQDPEHWDTSTMGVFNRPSPYTYQTLHDFTAPLVDDTKDSPLTPQQVRDLNYTPKSGYDYTGITEDMQRRAIRDAVPGLYGSPVYQYYRKIAENKLRRKGIDPTQEQIDSQLERDMLTSVPEYIGVRDEKVNPLYLDSARTSNDIRAHIAKAEYDRAHPDAKEQKALLELEDYKDATGRNGKQGLKRAAAKAQQKNQEEEKKKYSYAGNIFKSVRIQRFKEQREDETQYKPVRAQNLAMYKAQRAYSQNHPGSTRIPYTLFAKALTYKLDSGMPFADYLIRERYQGTYDKKIIDKNAFGYDEYRDKNSLVTAGEMLNNVMLAGNMRSHGDSFFANTGGYSKDKDQDVDRIKYGIKQIYPIDGEITYFVDKNGRERIYQPVDVVYYRTENHDEGVNSNSGAGKTGLGKIRMYYDYGYKADVTTGEIMRSESLPYLDSQASKKIGNTTTKVEDYGY